MNSTRQLCIDYQSAISIYLKKKEEDDKHIAEHGLPLYPPPLVPQIKINQWEEAKKNCTEKNTDFHVMTYMDRSFYLYCDDEGKHWCYTKFKSFEHIEPYYN